MLRLGRGLVREAPPAPSGPSFPEIDRLFFLHPSLLAQEFAGGITRPYAQHAWVYGCINAIAQNIAGISLLCFTGGRKNKRLVENHPLARLFETPNPMMSGAQLIEAAFVYLGLTGEAFFILDRESEREVPREIWAFHPRRFEEVVDKETGLIMGWKYRKGAKQIPLAPHEVVFFRYFNPYHDCRGLAPLQAAQAGIDQDHYASLYNKAFFRNSAMPGGVLETQANLSDEDFQRLLAQFEDRHQGVTKARRVALLEGGVTYKQTGLSQKDMDFLEQRKWNRDEIMMVFKVPKGELGIYEDLNFATSKTQDRIFWTKTLIPKMGLFEWTIWNQLCARLSGPEIWPEFDYPAIDALKDDLKDKVETGERLWKMGVPLNTVNGLLDLGLPEVAGGEVGYLPFNVAPVGGTTSSGEKGKISPIPSYLDLLPGAAGSPPWLAAPATLPARAFDGEAYWRVFLAVHGPLEGVFHRKVKRYFSEQRKRQLRLMEEKLGKFVAFWSSKLWVQHRELAVEALLLDLEAENGLLKQMVWPLYVEVGQAAGQALLVELGATPELFNLPDTPALAALEQKLIKVVGINDTVREQLRNTLMEGLGKLESTAELMDRVRQVYNFAQNRALTIARTETGQAMGVARDAAMEMLQVTKVRWVTAGDEHVRTSHQVLNGLVVVRGQLFPNGCRFPCDPGGTAGELINCRCVGSPVVE